MSTSVDAYAPSDHCVGTSPSYDDGEANLFTAPLPRGAGR